MTRPAEPDRTSASGEPEACAERSGTAVSTGPVPVEPTWRPRPEFMPAGEDVYAVGGDLRPGTLIDAYRHGVFPMGLGDAGGPPLAWWSPAERGVLWPGDLRITRSLRQAVRRFDVTVDTAFDDVVAGCADPSRPGAWITSEIAQAYRRLHDLGWAHSVEVWRDDDLVGGLYGVDIGGLFAGESMFHRATDASKVALVALVDIVRDDHDPARLIDMQWLTPHLASLGGTEMSRDTYLAAARTAVDLRPPTALRAGPWRPRGGEHLATPTR